MKRSLRATAVALAVAIAVPLTGGAARADGCADPVHPGGDWPSYGHDLSNTRMQDKETEIDASNVGSLAAAWSFDVAGNGGTGTPQSTPVVAEGCVYLTTTNGWIFALNADSGEVVWKEFYEATGSFGGMWSPAVVDGVLYVTVSVNEGPYAVALDAATGSEIWRSDPVADEPTVFSNAGAVVFDGLYFMGLSGGEGSDSRPGGWAILDATNGERLVRGFTVPDSDFALGFAGGSIWATAAVDLGTKYLYAGTGQPSNRTHPYEHHLTNAIVKIDVARARDALGNPVDSPVIVNPRFGTIVDAYKGNSEYAHAPLDGTTTCQLTLAAASTAGCIKEDVDFGASPNLFKDSRGYTVIGEYQKTGIYHAVYADTMTKAWTATMSQMIGPPYLANAAASAFDGEQVINVGSFPGQMVAVERDFGAYRWVAPVLNGTNYNPTQVANGVAYIGDSNGVLQAFDTSSGVPLLKRAMSADVGTVCTPFLSSSGAAIARNTVYATCGGWLIGYRLPS